jgi:hypothetical protein
VTYPRETRLTFNLAGTIKVLWARARIKAADLPIPSRFKEAMSGVLEYLTR